MLPTDIIEETTLDNCGSNKENIEQSMSEKVLKQVQMTITFCIILLPFP